jgi:LPS sulfotransferase NodH
LEEHVFQTFERIYERFEADRALIPAGRLYELRYEDLVQDSVTRMAEIYQQLGLGEFSQVRPGVEKYVAEHADYQTNRYQLKPELRDEISRRWSKFIEQYGYTAS